MDFSNSKLTQFSNLKVPEKILDNTKVYFEQKYCGFKQS